MVQTEVTATLSFVFGFSAAQPSPSAVPKTEDQRPQLGMFSGSVLLAIKKEVDLVHVFLKCVTSYMKLMRFYLLYHGSIYKVGTKSLVYSMGIA